MNWKLESRSVPKWLIFVCVMILAIALLGSYSYLSDHKSFVPAMTGGLCSGLAVLLLDKWLDKKEQKFLINRDYIESSLSTRENQVYYGELIRDSKKRIDFMGKNGSRLLHDFAEIENQYAARRALISAIQRNVSVRFLLAGESHGDKAKIDEVKAAFRKIKDANPSANLELRFYDFSPAFSYFRADDRIIFGPNFPVQEEGGKVTYRSRQTPSVVAGALSEVSKSYKEFFESIWDANEHTP